MIQATKLAYLDRHTLERREAKTEGGRSTPPAACPCPLMVCPEMDMCVIVTDKRDLDKERKAKITGKADWAYNYDTEAGSGQSSVLIAIGAKNPGATGQARCQLLTYLAIIKQFRKGAGKENAAV